MVICVSVTSFQDTIRLSQQKSMLLAMVTMMSNNLFITSKMGMIMVDDLDKDGTSSSLRAFLEVAAWAVVNLGAMYIVVFF